jgi:hypothetical protein
LNKLKFEKRDALVAVLDRIRAPPTKTILNASTVQLRQQEIKFKVNGNNLELISID